MGFVLTILYLITYYLSPPVLFGPLAHYHIEFILAAILIIVSIPALLESSILKTPQSLALAGLAFAVFMSVLIGMHWPGGAVKAFLGFIPNAFAFFLLCLHSNSKKKLQIVVLMLLFVCLLVIAHGSIDLLRGTTAAGPQESGDPEISNMGLWNIEHPYLLISKGGAGQWLYRLRGLGEINDPNDFGQLIVCLIPLMFIFWRTRKRLRNLLLVILPLCILLFGAYLTHSRGALVALIAVAAVASRRRMGTAPALIVAGGLFAGAMALQFTGGRAISADAGSDRTNLWGSGMEMLKSHPVFGVGFNNFTEYADNTAHNAVMVCAAELGLFGLFFWSLFLLPTVRDAVALGSPTRINERRAQVGEQGFFPPSTTGPDTIDKAEINRLGRLLILSLTGFLVTAMFLSRAFVLTFFLLGGMAEVVYQMALIRGMVAPRMKLVRLLSYAAGFAIASVLMMYVLLRILNLLR